MKYNYIYEITTKNDHPLIYKINKYYNINLKSAYCGSSLYYFIVEEAKLKIDIPKSKAPLARNWGVYGDTVWDNYHGWKIPLKDRIPKEDELFIIIFNWNGRYHVGAILEIFNFNFIVGEGNTSNIKVRKKEFAYNKNSNKEMFIKYTKQQGIFASKERYNIKGVYKIVRYKIL